MANTSFYSELELATLGLRSYGENVLISRFARLYSPENISIGDNVRIDDFCILSGNIVIGPHIHIAAYCALYGAKGIVLEDYTGLSARVTLYSAMDDFSGDYLVGPIHKEDFINVVGGPVILRPYSQVCANSIVFPNVTIEEGCVIGAMSLLKNNAEEWSIYVGIPCKKIKERRKGMLTFVNK